MDSFHRLLLATRNQGKVDEIRDLLADVPLSLVTAADLDDPPDVDEDAPTLQGNAAKKAAAFRAVTNLPALADDTGLEVDALNGRPGVHTARYAGPNASPDDNMRLLLEELEGVPDDERTARFRTVVCIVDDRDEPHFFHGTCEGVIITEPRGEGGFGYDPVFRPTGHRETFAEMPASTKNAISHRKRALEKATAFLEGISDG